MKPRIALISTINSYYKLGIWPKLSGSDRYSVDIFSSSQSERNIKTFSMHHIVNYGMNVTEIRNIYFRKKYLLFQIGVLKYVIRGRYSAYILPGEVTCVSTILTLFILKVRRIPSVVWTHGMYGRETKIKKKVKKVFYNFADKIFVYGNWSRDLLIDSGIKDDKVSVVFNSLNHIDQLKHRRTSNNTSLASSRFSFPQIIHPSLIYIGRITKRKKIGMLIEALHILQMRGNHYACYLIGDGEDIDNIKYQVAKYDLGQNVHHIGAIYDEEKISCFLNTPSICVSPGSIGLTALHCLAYGVPLITHNNIARQGPEVESITDGVTGLLFEEDNVIDLVKKIEQLTNIMNTKYNVLRKNCYDTIDRVYNPENQEEIISQSLLSLVRK